MTHRNNHPPMSATVPRRTGASLRVANQAPVALAVGIAAVSIAAISIAIITSHASAGFGVV